MTNEQVIAEIIAEVKIITKALQELHNYMTIVDKRLTALEAKRDNVPTEKVDTSTENVNRSTNEVEECD